MAKYLDERITVEFDGLTAEKVYNYFVYYNPDDAEKETIFAGNLYAESTTKTLDITDIVQNDITKRGYGKEFQYSVEIVNKVKEVSVYHIYRYPHKLAKYLYKIDTYYTDCKASDKEPILLPTYPETYTDNLQKEQYFSYSKKINPLRITASKITGNIGDSATFPALLTHSTEDYITSTFIDGAYLLMYKHRLRLKVYTITNILMVIVLKNIMRKVYRVFHTKPVIVFRESY